VEYGLIVAVLAAVVGAAAFALGRPASAGTGSFCPVASAHGIPCEVGGGASPQQPGPAPLPVSPSPCPSDPPTTSSTSSVSTSACALPAGS
jgi:hypothetical protein